jgi:hypothetical protein
LARVLDQPVRSYLTYSDRYRFHLRSNLYHQEVTNVTLSKSRVFFSCRFIQNTLWRISINFSCRTSLFFNFCRLSVSWRKTKVSKIQTIMRWTKRYSRIPCFTQFVKGHFVTFNAINFFNYSPVFLQIFTVYITFRAVLPTKYSVVYLSPFLSKWVWHPHPQEE